MEIRKTIGVLLLPLVLLSCKRNDSAYDATGLFEATEVLVSAQAAGEVVSLLVEEGTEVTAGQVLGTIDSTQLHLQKLALLASDKGVKAQRPSIATQNAIVQEQLRTLRSERARVERLLTAGVATQKQLDDLDNKIAVVQSQLAAQTSTLEKSSAGLSAQSTALEIQIAQLEEQLRHSVLTAPIDGTVVSCYIKQGELATPGRPLFKVAALDEMILRAYLTNDQLARTKLGDAVEVHADDGAGGMRTYRGRITWISSKAEFTPKTIQTKDERANLVYAVKIRVPNDGYLKIGMYGEVLLARGDD